MAYYGDKSDKLINAIIQISLHNVIYLLFIQQRTAQPILLPCQRYKITMMLKKKKKLVIVVVVDEMNREREETNRFDYKIDLFQVTDLM